MSKYDKKVTLILCVFLGWLGVHRFYAGKTASGILYLLTCGACGVGWLVDIILIILDKFKDGSGNYITSPASSTAPAPTASTSELSTGKTADTKSEATTKSETKIPSEIDGMPLAYKYFDVDICVISGQEPDYDAIADKLSNGSVILSLEVEPDNQYDAKAVKVMHEGSKLGYLYKGKIKDMAYDYLKSGRPIYSCLSSIDLDTNKMKMFIGFYYKKTYPNSVSFELTANSNSEMQENLSFSSEGDELSFYYDDDKEKYCFASTDDIGYAPASKNDLLDEISEQDDYFATIEEINEDENGKYSVTVTVEY